MWLSDWKGREQQQWRGREEKVRREASGQSPRQGRARAARDASQHLRWRMKIDLSLGSYANGSDRGRWSSADWKNGICPLQSKTRARPKSLSWALFPRWEGHSLQLSDQLGSVRTTEGTYAFPSPPHCRNLNVFGLSFWAAFVWPFSSLFRILYHFVP